MTAYEARVEAMAAALHADCILEWQAIALVDPGRALTMHMADAHYRRAHDLVRRLPVATARDAEVAQADERLIYDLVTALGLRFDADGTPCFCVTPDAVFADGTVEHRPRCRLARLAIERHRDALIARLPVATASTDAEVARLVVDRLVAYHRKEVSPTLQMNEERGHPALTIDGPEIPCRTCDLILSTGLAPTEHMRRALRLPVATASTGPTGLDPELLAQAMRNVLDQPHGDTLWSEPSWSRARADAYAREYARLRAALSATSPAQDREEDQKP